jgi:hypothetical protein
MTAGAPRPRHLRLVPPEPHPRRLSVTINVLDRRAPYGRSRVFRLVENDIGELIEHASRLEVRR